MSNLSSLSPRILIALIAALGALTSSPAKAEDIRSIDGRFEETVLRIGLNEERELQLETGKQKIPMRKVRTIDFNDSSKLVAQRSATLVLANGDLIRGAVLDGNADDITVQTASLGKLVVSLEKLRAVVLDPDMDMRDVEAQLRSKAANDVVLLRSGGEAKGVLEGFGKGELTIDMNQTGVLKIDYEKIRMVRLSLLGENKLPEGGTQVRLRLLDGSTLSGQLHSYETGVLTMTSLLAERGSIRSTDIQQLLVLNGSFVYLSDMEPSQVEQRFDGFKFYPEVFGWKRDRNVRGGVLKLGGKSYEKGLGVHSYTSLSYELGGKYKSFRAIVGLDDSVRPLGQPGLGSVTFRVLVDGKPAKEYADGLLLKKESEPQSISIDVSGAKVIALVADYGPTLHVLGRANWADAHLIR